MTTHHHDPQTDQRIERWLSSPLSICPDCQKPITPTTSRRLVEGALHCISCVGPAPVPKR